MKRQILFPAIALFGCAAAIIGLSRTKASPAQVSPPDRLVVHEWGTFTTLQAEDGKAIGGINTDDEPVPDFVHDLAGMIWSSHAELPSLFSKAIPQDHPDVYVRLETPVTYFYPPKGFAGPIDVKVTFRQGWLTQYYPNATAGGPDINEKGQLRWGRLTQNAAGSIEWKGLTLGGIEQGPKTDDKTWTSPREVKSASVQTPKGERERYLFYRGVGNLTAPLSVSRSASDDALLVRSDWPFAGDAKIGPMLLVDARTDGAIASRSIDAVDVSRTDKDRILATLPKFSESDYSKEGLPKVRAALHAVLVRDGLYDDEANAMLNTWEVSYFKRPGLRLFFSVPRQWTENYLPLAVSTSADITRVMIGRIEIVTPGQRATLRKIAKLPVGSSGWIGSEVNRATGGASDEEQEKFAMDLHAGHRSLSSAGINAPENYKAYLSLGRFRSALLLDEIKRRPSDALKRFAKNYEISAYTFEE